MSLILDLFRSPKAYSDEDRGWHPVTGDVVKTTKAGEEVSPTRAMQLSTYFACIRNIAEDVAKLPFKTYRRDGRSKRPAPEHSTYRLLHDEPNPEMVAFSFSELITQWAASYGNGYAEIVRDGRGQAVEMWPIHPNRVTIKRDSAGAMYYEIKSDSYQTTRLDPAAIFHLHGLGGNGLRGYSIVRIAAESMGIALAEQSFAGTFFANGTQLAGILQTPNVLNKEARNNLRESWQKMYSGADNAHKIAVLEQGLEWKPLGMPLEDAQFLESRQFQNEEIARWFRMPLHKLQEGTRAQGWSTLDAQNTDYLSDCLMPWLNRWEQEVRRKLFLPDERAVFFAEIDVRGILRGDSASRAAYYRERFNLASITPNEIRALENEDPIADPAADGVFIQGAMVPLDKAGQTSNAPAPSAPNGRPPGAEAPQNAVASIDPETLRPAIEDAAARVMRKQAKALENARARCKGNATAYAAWLSEFLVEQREYAINALAPMRVILAIPAPALNASISVLFAFGDAQTKEALVQAFMDLAHAERLSV